MAASKKRKKIEKATSQQRRQSGSKSGKSNQPEKALSSVKEPLVNS